MNAPYLPPVARPPHDPLSLVLDARLGWHAGALPGVTGGVETRPQDGALALAPLPGSGRLLAEDSGAFGGLALPRHAAWLPGGALLLLEARPAPQPARLRVLDPCECAWKPFACIDVGDPRVPPGTVAVAVACGELLLCVPGAHRVVVLDAHTGATRALWPAPAQLRPPGAPAQPAVPWTPWACATLPQGLVAVADPANGGVHLCSRRGHSLRFLGGLGAVQSLAVDLCGRLYVQAQGQNKAAIVDTATGHMLGHAARPAEVARRFAPLPAAVAADGAIDVAPLCAPPVEEPRFVGPDGVLRPRPALAPALYPAAGTWISVPLDSGIAGCSWDRIVLGAQLPEGCALVIATRSAEVELTDDELADAALWRAAGTWRGEPAGTQAVAGTAAAPPVAAADFMLRSPPGRYLWLRLALRGSGRATPLVHRLQLDFPRVSLRRYLPAVFGADPVAAEFTDRWLAVLDRGLRDIEAQVDAQARLFDPMAAPAAPEVPARRDFLALLAAWVGVTLVATWPLARKRRFVAQMPRLYPWRGTVHGLRAALHLFLGLDALDGCAPAQAGCVPCTLRERAGGPLARHRHAPRLLLEHFQLRRWMTLDHARLSDAARLWGERIVNRSRLESDLAPARTGRSDGAQLGVTQLDTAQDPLRDPFHVTAHRLSVFVPAACARTPALARALAAFVEAEKPAHVEARLHLVEPRFRVGVQAMLGLDAVIGWRSAPVTLGEARLGRATVLAGDAGTAEPRPPRHVGGTRVGMTTIVR